MVSVPDKAIFANSCKTFSMGCPQNHYWNYDFYRCECVFCNCTLTNICRNAISFTSMFILLNNTITLNFANDIILNNKINYCLIILIPSSQCWWFVKTLLVRRHVNYWVTSLLFAMLDNSLFFIGSVGVGWGCQFLRSGNTRKSPMNKDDNI